MIEVSHESPINILPYSQTYNDYDYALVHLFEDHESYYEYFVDSLRKGRTVYLDNSIFELGESFDESKYRYWINKLNPTLYIVPDTLESSSDTIDQFTHWLSEEDHVTSGAVRMGVVQGTTWTNLVECYQFMSAYADMIAISFDYSYYELTGYGDDPLHRMASGRQRFINQLIAEGIWNWNKPHHLLGCSLAKEFRYYNDNNIYNITSVDTSNPVVAAIKGLKYRAAMGLDDKPKTMLADLINHEITSEERDLVDYNTFMFKKILGR
jgi:hypothetical protein